MEKVWRELFVIVRERHNDFIMIQQHDHAYLSGTLYTKLKTEWLPSNKWKEELYIAIRHHDCGWKLFDEQPFWNDEQHKPHDFNDFPTGVKLVLYEHGINEVEKMSPFAALLCSKHYVSFLYRRTDPNVKIFIHNELKRQQRIQQELNINEHVTNQYYEILKLFDDLSLYLCLNEPGTPKEKEHPFFQHGIQIPELFEGGKVHLHWNNQNEVKLDRVLFEDDVITVNVPQKIVNKGDIAKRGLKKAYFQAEEQVVAISMKQVK